MNCKRVWIADSRFKSVHFAIILEQRKLQLHRLVI